MTLVDSILENGNDMSSQSGQIERIFQQRLKIEGRLAKRETGAAAYYSLAVEKI